MGGVGGPRARRRAQRLPRPVPAAGALLIAAVLALGSPACAARLAATARPPPGVAARAAQWPGRSPGRAGAAPHAAPLARPARGGEAGGGDRPIDIALRRAEEERAKSPLVQLLGLEGGLRRNVLLLAVWLAVGTLFYYTQGFEEVPSSSVATSFYYAVQAGLSIGFGILTPASEDSMLFTIGYILMGAAICANFLSSFVTEAVSSMEKGRLGIVIKETHEPASSFALLLGLWWLVGTLFGHFHEGWSWTRSLYFAVSATSTSGLQGLDSTDEASLMFCAVYALVGVPLYAAAVGRLSFSIAERVMSRRRAQLRERAARLMEACSEECTVEVFSMHDSSGTGRLSPGDAASLIQFLGNSRGMVVSDEDISYFMREFDEDGGGSIDREEFLRGIRRWVNELHDRRSEVGF